PAGTAARRPAQRRAEERLHVRYGLEHGRAADGIRVRRVDGHSVQEPAVSEWRSSDLGHRGPAEDSAHERRRLLALHHRSRRRIREPAGHAGTDDRRLTGTQRVARSIWDLYRIAIPGWPRRGFPIGDGESWGHRFKIRDQGRADAGPDGKP